MPQLIRPRSAFRSRSAWREQLSLLHLKTIQAPSHMFFFFFLFFLHHEVTDYWWRSSTLQDTFPDITHIPCPFRLSPFRPIEKFTNEPRKARSSFSSASLEGGSWKKEKNEYKEKIINHPSLEIQLLFTCAEEGQLTNWREPYLFMELRSRLNEKLCGKEDELNDSTRGWIVQKKNWALYQIAIKIFTLFLRFISENSLSFFPSHQLSLKEKLVR